MVTKVEITKALLDEIDEAADAIDEDPEFYQTYCNAYDKGGHDYYNPEMEA